MSARPLISLLLAGLTLVALAGCRSTCRRPCFNRGYPTFPSRPGPPVALPAPSPPYQAPTLAAPLPPSAPAPTYPSPGVAPTPPPPQWPAPAPPSAPAPVGPQSALPDQSRYFDPPEVTWKPPANGSGGVWATPSPATPSPSSNEPRDRVRLQVPETAEPPAAVEEKRDPRESPRLPDGIPGFAEAMSGVTVGLRPFLDGFDWLKANRYRAVLHVRLPGEDDGADRQLVEKLGLEYLSIEAAPDTLTPEVVRQFSRLVRDTDRRPLFIYDREGMLVGGLWYLHYRVSEREADETARKKATRLGLKDDETGEHRAMWLGIQKYLRDNAVRLQRAIE